MALEAYYAGNKQVKLAVIALLFLACGLWMTFEPNGSFEDSRRIARLASLLGVGTDTIGHGAGWICAAMGLAILPIILQQHRHKGPAMRIDDEGIYWHRWSSKVINWGNVATIRDYAVYRQRMVGVTLHNPQIDRSSNLLGKIASLNAKTGFGHLSLSAHQTDVTHEELVDAITYHLSCYISRRENASQQDLSRPHGCRTFGRRTEK